MRPHIDQPRRPELFNRDQVFIIGGQVGINDGFGLQQRNPFAVRGMGHHVGVAAVRGKGFIVGRDVEVHAPVVLVQPLPHALAGGQLQTRHPEDLTARGLQVVPQPFAIVAEEFVAPDLHIHGAGMYALQPCTVGFDQFNPIHAVPRPFHAEADQGRVGRRKLRVADPLLGFKQDATRLGFQINGEQFRRHTRRPAFQHPHALGLGEVERPTVRAQRRVFGLTELFQRRLVLGLQGFGAIGDLPQQQGVIGIGAGDPARRNARQLAHLFRVHMDGVQRLGAVLGLTFAGISDGIDGLARGAHHKQKIVFLALDEQAGLPVAQTHGDDARRRLDHHDIALRRIGRAIEVKHAGAVFVGYSYHAAARLWIGKGARSLSGWCRCGHCGGLRLRGLTHDQRQQGRGPAQALQRSTAGRIRHGVLLTGQV
ncbi:hypothetical protein EM6_3186 (plasmid) [Asticcacaulis excentricus]|uniref:Uncharacterized protein n=1 Tax=Asticcacaulis excentricus TaxID=78587 RepID=A0A3G9G917_9CAUL|nr:hypothetical protein EM6_3186 [Asticcacaulis excentricus]